MKYAVYEISRMLAWVGVIVLTVIATVSVVSIAGRALSGAGLGPVPGDFEIVEAGTAIAVFCFLPWGHLKRGHASVDLLWRVYPAGLKRAFETLSDALMLGVWLLLTWRMAHGAHDYYENGELTFILQFPVWWGYGACLVPASLGCVAYALRLMETLGLVTPPEGFGGAEVTH